MYMAPGALEQLYHAGEIRAIGVSNFYPDRVMDVIMTNAVTPAVNQIEVNPIYQRTEGQRFLQANRVQTEAWAPFAEGRNHLFQNETLVGIGKKYGKSVGQVVLRWLLQRDVVALAKSTHKERIVENIGAAAVELTPDDLRDIESAADKITVQGARYPEELERRVGR